MSHRDFIRHNILNFVLKRRIVLHTDTHISVVRTVEYIARIDILFTCSSHSINYGRFAWLLLKRIAQITNHIYCLIPKQPMQFNQIESYCVFSFYYFCVAFYAACISSSMSWNYKRINEKCCWRNVSYRHEHSRHAKLQNRIDFWPNMHRLEHAPLAGNLQLGMVEKRDCHLIELVVNLVHHQQPYHRFEPILFQAVDYL